MIELTIDRLRVRVNNATGHEQRLELVARLAAALVADRLALGLLAPPAAPPRASATPLPPARSSAAPETPPTSATGRSLTSASTPPPTRSSAGAPAAPTVSVNLSVMTDAVAAERIAGAWLAALTPLTARPARAMGGPR